jgi:hypothetical protein
MAGKLNNKVRIEQSYRELDAFQDELRDWLKKRRRKDILQRYFTQLKVLEETLTDSLVGIRSELDRLDSLVNTLSLGEVYAACRSHDKQLVLVQRVWNYYQSKFDQRDDDKLKDVLAAADEVVWSCYAEVFGQASLHANREIRSRSIPLPYIEPQYSPQAIPRDEPPADLKSDKNDAILNQYLYQLPVPIVSLPPVCVKEPWWLIYLGHEVGHHLQYDLMPKWGLVGYFGELLQEITLSGQDPKCDTTGSLRWRNWGKEIFADICSVCSMGSSAVRAMVELELADDRTMLSSKTNYPSPMVRLELLARVADSLGLDVQVAVGYGLNREKLINGPP